MKFLQYILILITPLTFVVGLHGQNAVLAGWHTWDAGTGSKLDDNTPDVLASGFSAIAGINVEPAFTSVGGGHQVLTNANSTIAYVWPNQLIGVQSVASLRPANNGLRYLDFQITNNNTSDYQLTRFQFQYRKAETTTPAGTAITLAHLDGSNNLSDLVVNNAYEIASVTPTSSYTWFNVSVDLSTLPDNVIGSGERAAFRLSLPNLSSFVNWNVDNVAISGAIVPEPKTYALFLGSLVLLVGWFRRRD
jgi:hypothetical protein